MPKEALDEPLDMDADSSAAPALDDNADAALAADATPADSSAATDETEVDNLSVVRDVVGAQKDEPAAAASSAEGEENETGDDKPAEQDDENFSDVPFSKHPRFQQLLRKAKTFEQDAVRYQNVEKFLDEVNITPDEAADVMLIAGLAKTNPVEAWKRAQSWVQTLLVAAGEVLPQDLQQRVANKELSHEAALEMSRLRAATAAQKASTEFQQQRGQRQQGQQMARTLVDTAEQWVNNRQIRDPNFAAKQPRLMERIAFLQRTEGRPNTVDGVRAQLKKAYDFVNKEHRPAPVAANQQNGAPVRRPAIKPVNGGQVASNASQAKPTSTLEAIRQVRQRATA